ncbi:MAG: hypothetical protein NZL98_04750 [Anaerolineales bacterium]|nr:hypothetical protein [Anaerolineales bacterium]MDW8226449.1 hypothetical protein [Anaerolineales bacterium]
MSRFILIDQSIIDLSGHHYEYAVRVLSAAERAGYTPVLATNRRFKPLLAPWRVYPVYRYGFWFRLTEPRLSRVLRAWLTSLRQLSLRLKYELIFSPLGLLWVNRHAPVEFLKLVQAPSLFSLLLLALGFYWPKVLGAGFRLLWAAVPFRSYIKGLYAGLVQFLKALLRPFILVLRPSEDVLRWLAKQRKKQAFGEDTLRLFRQVHLREGDVVFIPTLDEAEMLGLLNYFRRDPRSKLASWHLLFRRNIYSGRDPEYSTQDESLRPLRNAFRYFQQQLAGQDVHFYTDTKQLTAQYNRLGSVIFHTLPIPVGEDYSVPSSPQDGHVPLCIAYVGDARSEKGYHFLPHIVQDLWDNYMALGRVRFVIQSNYNSPQGEPAAVVARAQLQSFPCDKVNLILNPLSTEAYRDLVLGSDVILILYDRDNYYARSSGIFAEALVAGKPVVVPAGTWMALQLEPFIYQYHEQVRQTETIVRTRLGQHLRWCRPGATETITTEDGSLVLSGEAILFCWLAAPTSATHLLLTFRQRGEPLGHFTQISIEQLDRSGDSVAQKMAVVGGGTYPSSLMVSLEPQAWRIKLGLRNAFSLNPLEICDLRVDFLSVGYDLPLSAIGVVYSDPEEISKCCREIVDHVAHYRAWAKMFSEKWAAYHNPVCLLEHLVNYTRETKQTAPVSLSLPNQLFLQ